MLIFEYVDEIRDIDGATLFLDFQVTIKARVAIINILRDRIFTLLIYKFYNQLYP